MERWVSAVGKNPTQIRFLLYRLWMLKHETWKRLPVCYSLEYPSKFLLVWGTKAPLKILTCVEGDRTILISGFVHSGMCHQEVGPRPGHKRLITEVMTCKGVSAPLASPFSLGTTFLWQIFPSCPLCLGSSQLTIHQILQKPQAKIKLSSVKW